MNKIKISEIFLAPQGEAKFMGVPSVFLRTFGCNFTCGGFGMPKGKVSEERNIIANNIKKYKNYNDLPLVSTGCDSYPSWDTRFKHMSPLLTISAVVDRIIELLVNKKWEGQHLVITGGEPLLGWQKAYNALLCEPRMIGLNDITFETNGTQKLIPEFSEYIKKNWRKGWDSITFSVSPKLTNSGETKENAIKPEVILQYQEHGYTYLKFVVATEEDIDEIKEVVKDYSSVGFKGPVYLMPCGGTEDLYNKNKTKVAILALKNNFRYSDRLQIPLFKNAWGT
jgi:organic radical activating enzyme